MTSLASGSHGRNGENEERRVYFSWDDESVSLKAGVCDPELGEELMPARPRQRRCSQSSSRGPRVGDTCYLTVSTPLCDGQLGRGGMGPSALDTKEEMNAGGGVFSTGFEAMHPQRARGLTWDISRG